MRPILSPDSMRRMEERYFSETGTPSIELMERAASALAAEVLRFSGETVYVAAGSGGNGGDGYAAARILASTGRRVTVISTSEPKTPDAAENARRVRACAAVLPAGEIPEQAPDIWVDALFGIGLTRAPSGAYERITSHINRDKRGGSVVVSADVPSGLDAQTGKRFPACVEADLTVAFQVMKYGHVLADGPDVCGRTVAVDIGIPDSFLPSDAALFPEREDILRLLPKRIRNSHKGTYGHLLIVAGSFGMAGAAAMCAMAAARSGAGLVTVACPASIVPIVQTLAPTAVCAPMPEEDGRLSEAAAEKLRTLFPGKRAVAMGCGLGNADPAVVRAVLESGLPAVIDADGLNIIARNGDMKQLLNRNHILTPHPGEAARLLGHPADDPVRDGAALTSLGCTAILKGTATVISGDKTYINPFGAPGMAKGGSGDVLTGVMGALLAGAPDREKALTALLACAAAGLAGEEAARIHGNVSMLPTDTVSCLSHIFREAGA